MVRFFVLGGHDIGRSADLGDGDEIGRAEGLGLRLGDRSISRHHARLELRGEAWFLVDLASTNGLWHDHQRVDKLELEDFLELRIGDVELRVRLSEDVEPTPLAEPAPEPPVAVEPPTAPAPVIEFHSGGGAGALADDSADDEVELEIEWDGDEPESTPAAAPARPAPAAGGVRDLQREQLLAGLERRGGGFLTGDLTQSPGWVQALVWLALLLFAGGLLFGVSQLVLWMRATS